MGAFVLVSAMMLTAGGVQQAAPPSAAGQGRVFIGAKPIAEAAEASGPPYSLEP